MHFSDLAPLPFPPFAESGQLKAVGWLEPGHDYSTGEVGEEFVRKLAELLFDPWQPGVAMGRHQCGFCRLSGGPGTFRLPSRGNSDVSMGCENLWLPANGFLFVAPSLILHYMDAHGYAPPRAFQEATLACPPMRSLVYLKAILQHGPPRIANPHSIPAPPASGQ